MGALVIAVGKENRDVSSDVISMLQTLSHRKPDAYGIATHDCAIVEDNLDELARHNLAGEAIIGHAFTKNMPRDRPQPLLHEDFTLVFEGRFFPPSVKSEAEVVKEHLAKEGNRGSHILQKFNGNYVFALVEAHRILVGRDALGLAPLYFGANKNLYAVSSEKKPLWRIGIKDPHSFPCGAWASLDEKGYRIKTERTLPIVPEREITMEEASEQLKQTLLQSSQNFLLDVEEAAVAFSGGIDSSIVAVTARECGVDVHLVCVELDGRKQSSFAARAARALKLPFHLTTYSISDLELTLSKVLWLVEEPNPLTVSIAIPIFWTAEQSAALGFRVLLHGQGGDELFGGYHRYLDTYRREGSEALQRKLHQELISAWTHNFERDSKVCAFHRVEPRTPFADWDLILLAASLPLNLKVSSQEDRLRKRVLRRTGRMLGLPEFITENPKKAIQYSTGVSKGLRKVAKGKGVAIGQHLKETFNNIEWSKRP